MLKSFSFAKVYFASPWNTEISFSSSFSFLQSLVAVGAIFGCPIGGWAIDKFGRKKTLVLCSVPFELGWLVISFAQNRAVLYSGRISTGLVCGIVSLATPAKFFLLFFFK